MYFAWLSDCGRVSRRPPLHSTALKRDMSFGRLPPAGTRPLVTPKTAGGAGVGPTAAGSL